MISRLELLTAFSTALLLTQHAAAQQDQPHEPKQPKAVEQALDDSNIKPHDYSKPGDEPKAPTPPGTNRKTGKPEKLDVAVKAGEGSKLAYGRASVVELGGNLALLHSSQTTTFTLAPSLGYFVADGFEVTVLPELRVTHLSGNNVPSQTDVSVGGSIEPSFHLAFNQTIYGFVGLGVGVRYSDDPGFDLFFRPSLGLDILIGRSGILKPALFMDVGTNDGVSAGGFQAGFTVML